MSNGQINKEDKEIVEMEFKEALIYLIENKNHRVRMTKNFYGKSKDCGHGNYDIEVDLKGFLKHFVDNQDGLTKFVVAKKEV